MKETLKEETRLLLDAFFESVDESYMDTYIEAAKQKVIQLMDTYVVLYNE